MPAGSTRTALNILDNPSNKGKEVLVYGDIQKYCSKAGVKNTNNYEFITTNSINSVKATELNANAPIFNLAGQQVTKEYKGVVIQNGKKFMKK